MKKTMSRLLSILLVVAMVCAMVPAAFASDAEAVFAIVAPEDYDARKGILVEESLTLTTENAAEGDVTWSSSKESVATVADGVVTAVGVGETTITATDSASASDTFEVKVYDVVTAFEDLTAERYTVVKIGSTYKMDNLPDEIEATLSVGGSVDFDVEWKHALEGEEHKAIGTIDVEDGYVLSDGLTEQVKLDVAVKSFPSLNCTTPATNNVTVNKDATKELKVEATCAGAELSYQWMKNSVEIPGATAATYTVPAEDTATDGTTIVYTCVISAEFEGVAAGKEIVFNVTVPSENELILSAPSQVYEGEDFNLTATYKKDGTAAEVGSGAKIKFYVGSSDDADKVSLNTKAKTTAKTWAANSKTKSVTVYTYDKDSSLTLYAELTLGDGTVLTASDSIKIKAEDDDDYYYYEVIEYYGDASDDVSIDARDFEDFLNEEYYSDNLEWVKFDLEEATKYGSTYGYLYENSTGSTKVDDGYSYDYDEVDDMEFRFGTKTSEFIVEIPFEVKGDGGSTHKVDGILLFYANGAEDDYGYGYGDYEIEYYTESDEEVSLDADDFEDFLQDEHRSDEIEYVEFYIDEAEKYGSSYGYLYRTSTGSSKVSDGVDYDYNEVDDMEFRAGSKTSEYVVEIPFLVKGDGGANHKVEGTLAIYVNYEEDYYGSSSEGDLPVSGATLKKLGIADEIEPNVSASSLYKYYAKFDVTGGTLYLTSNTKASNEASKSTKFYFDPSSSQNDIADAYLVPDKSNGYVYVEYTIYNGNSVYDEGEIRLTVGSKSASDYFTDVTASTVGTWAAEGIDYLYESGIINGTGGTKFSPNNNLTRADLVTMLYRYAGSPSVTGIKNPFADVASGKYYYEAILWAYSNGIVNGVGTNKFAPESPVTRQQIAAILYRHAGEPSATGSFTGFTDGAKVESFATDAMKWAIGEGIISGNGNQLQPKHNATRAQVAVMLYRYITG